MSKRLRVAICDDSRTYAAALQRFLERDPEIEVVGLYGSAEQLIDRLPADRPDLVTMDLELPGLDGVDATERILGGRQPVPVVVLSAHVSPGSERAAAALAAGAVDAILKSDLRLVEADGEAAGAIRRRIKRLSRARVRPRPAPRPTAGRPATSRPRTRPTGPVRAIGVASSTGGPQALAVLLGALPASFPIPLLVVQHIAPGFTTGLASWLDRQVPLPVAVAPVGRTPGPGVWFAPDEAHLVVEPGFVLGRDTKTVAGRHRPAADVLLTSMARTLRSHAAAVVLTGLGRDGAAGTADIVRAGGFVIAQDEESSVVFGMPGSAVKAGAQSVLALEDIAQTLKSMRPA